MLQWPSTLPKFLAEGWSEEMPELTERIEMEAGPAYVRGKSTVAEYGVSGTLMMTQAQWVIFRAFYLSDTRGGAIPFEITHPASGGVVVCRISQPPRREYGGKKDYYRVSVPMEVLP